MTVPVPASAGEVLNALIQERAMAAHEIDAGYYDYALQRLDAAVSAGQGAAEVIARYRLGEVAPVVVAILAARSDQELASALRSESSSSVSGQQPSEPRGMARWVAAAELLAQGKYEEAAAEAGRTVLEVGGKPIRRSEFELIRSARWAGQLAAVFLGQGIDPDLLENLSATVEAIPGNTARFIEVRALRQCPHGRISYDGNCPRKPPCPQRK